MMNSDGIDVSIILPVHNAEVWLDECLESVASQDFQGKIEISAFNDASSDKSKAILKAWSSRFKELGIKFVLDSGSGNPKGVGYAKNCAIAQSSGQYLCFLDADDIMMCSRIRKQYEACYSKKDTTRCALLYCGMYVIFVFIVKIVGSQFHRKPADSTPRYTSWANNLSPSQLYSQIYTAFGPTVIMPTWFCHREVPEKVGGFDEGGKGTPEDLLFFYLHLRLGGKLIRVEEDLLLYRYHPSAATFSISEDTIWKVRLDELEHNVLTAWPSFTIWNAGKQGRKFYRSLSDHNKSKVQAFCDVDVKKISKGIYIYEKSAITPKPKIPIVLFSEAKPPFIICVKLDMTAGLFEENLSSLNLTEDKDYVHFS